MAKQIVSLYIDEGSLRLVVSRGDHIKEWAYLPLDSGLMENNLVIKPAELASRIKLLFKTLKINSKSVSIGISGLHCLNRIITLPKLPKDMLEEAVRHEARRVLPVAPEQLYISWQVVGHVAAQTRILLVALPIATVDALAGALHLAGLKPNFLGIKPLLVAGSCDEPTGVVVDIQQTEFDITVLVNGVPQAIRTVPLPGSLSSDAKLSSISAELNRIIGFYNTNNPEDALRDDLRVFVSGQLGDNIDLCKSFADSTGREVLPLPAPLNFPDGFDGFTYLANIGLMLNRLRGSRGTISPKVTINSLPVQYQTRAVSLVNVSVLSGTAVAAVSILFLVLMNQNASASVSSLALQAAAAEQATQAGLSQKLELSSEIKDLESKLQMITTNRNNYQTAMVTISEHRERTNQDLSAIINDLPAAISLSSIKHTGDTLEISGLAQAEDNILRYFTELENSDLFGEIAITNMSKVQSGTGFTISVNREKSGDEISAIKVALRFLPADVSLTNFSQSKEQITLNARAPNEDSIVLFLRKLEESKLFSEIAISGKATNQSGEIDFTLFVKM